MNVYIKNMKMPDGPWACPLFDEYGNCAALYEVGNNNCSSAERDDRGFPYWCPLVPVPPHGRLIDADALLKGCERVTTEYATREFAFSQSAIENAPTILEAEEGET